MPIFEQGYQHWHGRLSGHAGRWLTITRRGVRAQLRHRGTRFVVLGALVPALALAGAMVLWGLLEQKSSLVMPFVAAIQGLPEELKSGPKNFRGPVWVVAFYFFFQVQIFFSMLLVVFVGPNLISQDLRFNALPLYFSRPLRRSDYFLGKLGVIAVYLAAVTIAPAVLAYLLGLGFSLDPGVLRDTARLLGASVVYGVVVVLSAGALMLALSSLSRNSRYVGAMWIAVWLVGDAAAGVVHDTAGVRWGWLLSYTTNLKRIGAFLLGTDAALERLGGLFPNRRGQNPFASLIDPFPWYWSAGVLAALFGISLWILTLRVKSLDRLK